MLSLDKPISDYQYFNINYFLLFLSGKNSDYLESSFNLKNLSNLESLSDDIAKLYDQTEHADATLKCGDRSFSVHRNILAMRSSVFSAMFEHDMSEKNSGVVDIVDLDPNILEQFLLYLYSGKIEEMCMDTAFELYKTAEKYAVHSLKQLCVSYILDKMEIDNVCKILLFADQYGDANLLDNAITFAADVLDSIQFTEWKDFAFKFPTVAVKVYAKYHEENIQPTWKRLKLH